MQRVQKMCLLACYKMVDVVIIGEESFDTHFFEGLKRQLVGPDATKTACWEV